MAQFPLLKLTRTGQEMTGMSQGGGKLTFVRVELGDGDLKEGDSIETLTALKHGVMQLPLQGYQSDGNGKARLRFIVDNSALAAGFINREIGVFAKIENGEEQLYAYTNAGNYADWIPSKETPIDGDIVDLHIVIGNAPNVVIETMNGAYATKIDIEEHNKAPGAHADIRTAISNASIAILGRSKTYAVGDIAYHKALPSWARLECVTAGTTGSNANVFSKNVKAGQYIIDGGVRWIVDDVRDCNRVGSVTGALYLPDGYIKANGATVNRADYPRLVTLANKYNLWTSDSTGRDLGLFGRADGSTTMVLPNWIDRMLQFSDCNNGTEYGWTVKAGLPNIEGYITSTSGYGLWWGADGGVEENQKEEYNPSNSAIQLTNEVRRGHKADSSPYPATKKPAVNNNTIRFNAALNNPIYGRSNTVQPAAIQLFPIIKY